MEGIGTLAEAEAKVLSDALTLLAEFARVGAVNPESAEEAVSILSALRDVAYENLNQIQHEYLILAAVRHLVKNKLAASDTDWQWNPRQTGGADESDLRGIFNGQVNVSAEVTTSKRPIGTIIGRMQNTLRKLAGDAFSGSKFYFVRTEAMERRARAIVESQNYPIFIIRLGYLSAEL